MTIEEARTAKENNKSITFSLNLYNDFHSSNYIFGNEMSKNYLNNISNYYIDKEQIIINNAEFAMFENKIYIGRYPSGSIEMYPDYFVLGEDVNE